MIDKKEVLNMKPGRKMDFLVEQKVLNKRSYSSVTDAAQEISLDQCIEIPHYSTNVYSAEKALEKTRERYPIMLYGTDLWECRVFLPTGAVVSSGLTRSLSLAICRAALLTVINERQDKAEEHRNRKKFDIFLKTYSNMKKKEKKLSRLLTLVGSFFITGLILLSLWNAFLVLEIKRSGQERVAIKKDIKRIEVLEEVKRNFIKDIIRYKAIAFCFLELIGEHGEKYTEKEKQDCIQLIVVTDEKHGHEGFDAPLILAWLEKESLGNPEAVSYAGAKGLTQLMDFKAEEVLTAMGYPGYDEKLVFNPVVNLGGGLYCLEDFINFWKLKGIKSQSLSLFYGLHSYKWGAGNTAKLFNSGKKDYRPAIEYVNWILNRKEYWKEMMKYLIDNAENGKEMEGKKDVAINY